MRAQCVGEHAAACPSDRAHAARLQVDGMNVLAVREAVKVAMAHARTEGPVMMEMDTYRYHGHSMPRAGPKKCARPRLPQPTALATSWSGPCRLLAALRTRDAPPGLGG